MSDPAASGNVFAQLLQTPDSELDGLQPPSQKIVDVFHGKASVDRPEDIHHRIGFGLNDASSGAHTHNGKDSNYLITNTVLTDLGPTPTSAQIQAAMNQLNAVLRTLGAQ